MAPAPQRRWTLPMLALLLGVTPAGASDDWQVKERNDDFVLYVSSGADSRYQTYKLETTLDAEPGEAVESLLVLMTSAELAPEGQERRVLEQTDDGFLVHTFIDMPMLIADRDVALRVTREPPGDGGARRVAWTAVADGVPPPKAKVVRIPESTGYWEFVPDGPGRSRAVYVTHSDLGGSIPAWLINSLMRDQVAGDVDRLRRVISDRARAVGAAPPDGD